MVVLFRAFYVYTQALTPVNAKQARSETCSCHIRLIYGLTPYDADADETMQYPSLRSSICTEAFNKRMPLSPIYVYSFLFSLTSS